MDGIAQARTAQLRSFTSSILSNGASLVLSAAQTREMCHALVSGRLVAQAAMQTASSTRRGELQQAVDAWFAAVTKGIQSSGQVVQQAQYTQLMAASITVCDMPRLLLNYQSWATLLLDTLKSQRDQLTQSLDASDQQPSTTGQQLSQQQQQQSRKRSRALQSDVAASAEAATLARAVNATCDAVAHMFNRLADVIDVGGVRREASALASRACGLAIPLLSLTGTSCQPAVTAALQLVSRLVDAAPASLRNHTATLEPAVVAVVAGAGVPASTRKAAATCLAGLPRIPGDAASYSEQFRRLLLSLHDILDAMLMGLDDPATAAACRAPLAAAASGPTPAAAANGGAGAAAGSQPQPAASQQPLLPLSAILPPTEGAASSAGTQRRVHGPTVKALGEVLQAGMHTAHQMLTAAFPVPVPLPCGPLLHLASRLLRFSDSQVLASGRVPPSSTGFQQLQAALPQLHHRALGLLHTLTAVAGTAMVPLHAALARLLAELLRRLKALGPGAEGSLTAACRDALYQLAAAACRLPAGGLLVARTLAVDALGAVRVELYGWTPEGAAATGVTGLQNHRAVGAVAGAGLLHSPQALDKPVSKKAKANEAAEVAAGAEAAAAAAAAAAGPAGCFAAGSSAAAAANAALELLAAVVAAAGSLLPASVRAAADSLAYHLAATASDAAVRAEHEPSAVTAAHAAGLQSLRAEALRTLLTTLLTPVATRPPYLSQAVALFSHGCSCRCAAVAAVCREATGSLEALLHPRAVPITGVRQLYTGVSDVTPLPMPKLWSAHLHVPQAPPSIHPLAAAAPQPMAVAPAVLPPQTASASAGPAAVPALSAAPIPAAPQAAAARPKAAQPHTTHSAAVPAASAQRPNDPMDTSESGSQQPAGNDQPPAVEPAGSREPAPSAELQRRVTVSAASQQQQQQQQRQAPQPQHPAESAATGGPSQRAATVTGRGVGDAGGKAFGDESSDSEGALPDIDMGDSDGDEEEEGADSDE